jgi:retron-type reverse transcriptase
MVKKKKTKTHYSKHGLNQIDWFHAIVLYGIFHSNIHGIPIHLHTHNAITPTISKLPSVPPKINF